MAALAGVVAAVTMGTGIAVVIALACSGCSGDSGTSVEALERRGGGFSGSGAPSTPTSSSAPSSNGSNGGGGPTDSPSPLAPVASDDAGSSAPIATSEDAGTTTTTGTTNEDAGTPTSAGGCPEGCADACLTLAMNFCQTSAADDYQDLCDQLPATCACNETGAPLPTPSIQQCIAELENGDDGDDDAGN